MYLYDRNDYILDRLLANLRFDRLKVLRGLVKRYSHHEDDNYRFVISQASFNANWLTFRSRRTRDKSTRQSLDRIVPNQFELEFENLFLDPYSTERLHFIVNPFASMLYFNSSRDWMEETSYELLTQLGVLD
jgi:hypothetical protein